MTIDNEEREVPPDGMTVGEAAEEMAALLTDEDVAVNDPDDVPDAIRADQAAAEPDGDEDGDEDGDDEPEDDEDDEEAKNAEDEAEPRKWKVKAAGEELEVDEAELIKGYQRHVDYVRKTAEVAQQRRELDGHRDTARQAIESLVQNYEAFADYMTKNLPAAEVEHIQDQYRTLRQIQAQDQYAQLAHQQEAERALLLDAVPEWKDAAIAKADAEMITNYATAYGYTEDDIASVVDHRLFLILRDAARYRQAETKGRAKVAAVPAGKVLRPGAKPVQHPQTSARKSKERKLENAQRRARKSGRSNDVAAYAEALIDMMGID